MNILVTAGNTQTPIDKVRCLTNIFTGRTGAAIALEASRRGHGVRLLTSHPEAVAELSDGLPLMPERWQQEKYWTFANLHEAMEHWLRQERFDAVIHSAAVSDYLSGGIYASAGGTAFDPTTATWRGSPPMMIDRAAGKVKSDEPELWLRLVRAPKLVDKVRTDWGFGGVLVKFKLEVGVDEAKLLDIAERSRRQSQATLMVANTLEGSAHWAYLGPLAADRYEKVGRRDLARKLLDAVESTLDSSHG